MSGWMIGLIIAIPFLFLIGVIYNSIKEQSTLEKKLPQVLAERKRRQRLPKDHPDYIYVKPYDDDDEDALPQNHGKSLSSSGSASSLGQASVPVSGSATSSAAVSGSASEVGQHHDAN